MKKIITAWLFFALASSLRFAGQASAQDDGGLVPDQTDTPASTAVKAQRFTGKIDSIWEEDADGTTTSHLSVRDDAGHPTHFTVAKDAAIIGKDGNATTLSWIEGSDVSLAYVIDQDGLTKKVTSIKVVDK